MEMVNEVAIAFNEFRAKQDGTEFQYENAFAMDPLQDAIAVSTAVRLFLDQVLTPEYEVLVDGHTVDSKKLNFLPFVFMVHFRVYKAKQEKENSPAPDKSGSGTISA